MFVGKSIHLDSIRRKRLFGEWTPSGLRYIPKAKERHIGGTKHDDKRQQIELIGHVMDQLGSDAWTWYANLQGHKVKRFNSVFLTMVLYGVLCNDPSSTDMSGLDR